MSESSVAHAHDTHEQEEDNQLWEGGQEPMKASYGKLMMWYFLVSDAFTFAGFLIAYGALRFSSPTWPESSCQPRPRRCDWCAASADLRNGPAHKRAVFWMFLTVLGGATFLGSQAYEWTTLIKYENVSVTRNPFGRYTADGELVDVNGKPVVENGGPVSVKKDQSYILHGHEHDGQVQLEQRYIKYTSGPYAGQTREIGQGPKAFGALFFFITGFHGFHVFSGVLFLAIIMINAMGGLYATRKNGYEMVEKIGLYWHFVDLVWVFVFLVFYLL